MDQKLLFYPMLMIVSIGIQMNILENGFLIPWERDSMWTSGIWTLVYVNNNFSIEGSFMQTKFKNRVFVNWDRRYT